MMSIKTKKLVRQARRITLDLAGYQPALLDAVVDSGRTWYYVGNPLSLKLTEHDLHLARVDGKQLGFAGTVPLHEITWLGVSPDYRSLGTLCLESPRLEKPIWIHLRGRAFIDKFVGIIGLQDAWKFDLLIDGSAVTVEYRPVRVGLPGGWFAGPDGITTELSGRAIDIAKKALRQGHSGGISELKATTPIDLEEQTTGQYVLQSYLRPLIGFLPHVSTLAVCREGKKYAVALTAHEKFVIAEIYVPTHGHADKSPWFYVCNLSDIDARAALFPSDGPYIFIYVPGAEKGLKVSSEALGDNSLWRPFIAKAVSGPGPRELFF